MQQRRIQLASYLEITILNSMKLATLLRFVFRLSLFSLIAMLLWSSFLVERNLQTLRRENESIKKKLNDLQKKLERTTGELTGSENQKELFSHSSLIDRTFPNLLHQDLFYMDTLPRLLGDDFKPRGARKIASIGKPNNLHPFSNWGQVTSWIGLCQPSLARLEFGKYETLAPDLAIKIEERKDNEFWVHLRDNVYWQPLSEDLFEGRMRLSPWFLRKHKVTAYDFKFYFNALMNPFVQESGAVALRNYLSDIEDIEVIDDLTFVVRWRAKETVGEDGKTRRKIKYAAKQLTGGLKPLASFVYQYFPDGTKIIEDDSDPDIYRKSSIWAQNFVEHWARNIIVSCGPWIFEKMTDRLIKFRRNDDHFFPLDALCASIREKFKNTPDDIWQDFKAGRLDNYHLQPDQQLELDNFLVSGFYKEQVEKGLAIKRLDYPARQYSYIGWNQKNPLFQSKKVRQALTMAIDRERIIKQFLNGLGLSITGSFALDSASYDRSVKPWPYDPQKALRFLEEEGWYDADGDGIIDKDFGGTRKPFAFSLTYYVKNPTTKALCEYIAHALSEIGIKCRLNGVDIADLSMAVEGKNFDALFLAWGLGSPPEDPRQLWHSSGANEPGSSNYIGFANGEVDEIIDRLTYEDDRDVRKKLYHRFHRIIHEEQPYTFLYVPIVAFLYRQYLQNVFIPAKRQDLVPGADIDEPVESIFWIKDHV